MARTYDMGTKTTSKCGLESTTTSQPILQGDKYNDSLYPIAKFNTWSKLTAKIQEVDA
jgi:hypothetical protein